MTIQEPATQAGLKESSEFSFRDRLASMERKLHKKQGPQFSQEQREALNEDHVIVKCSGKTNKQLMKDLTEFLGLGITNGSYGKYFFGKITPGLEDELSLLGDVAIPKHLLRFGTGKDDLKTVKAVEKEIDKKGEALNVPGTKAIIPNEATCRDIYGHNWLNIKHGIPGIANFHQSNPTHGYERIPTSSRNQNGEIVTLTARLGSSDPMNYLDLKTHRAITFDSEKSNNARFSNAFYVVIPTSTPLSSLSIK